MIRTYIETLLEMPWEKRSEENNDIQYAEKVLDEDHYGLETERGILEFHWQSCLTRREESPILCLVGPREQVRHPLQDHWQGQRIGLMCGFLLEVRDEAEIRGHRKTYVGAMPGRIANGRLRRVSKNPVLLLDEIDKVSTDYKEIHFSAFWKFWIQNRTAGFRDHYLEVPLDLSEVMFITTANSLQTIPRPLLDRMEIIEISSYTENEKLHIAQEHLIPKHWKDRTDRTAAIFQ